MGAAPCNTISCPHVRHGWVADPLQIHWTLRPAPPGHPPVRRPPCTRAFSPCGLAPVPSRPRRARSSGTGTRPPGSPQRWSCSCCSLPCSRPGLVWAQDLTPALTVAEGIRDFLVGDFARALAAIGLAACGFLAFAGRMPWSVAIAVIGGIILVFGAVTMVEEIADVAGGG